MPVPPPILITNKLLRRLVFVVGWLSFILGVIGAFLPVLPTTPFMLLTAACFSRSSPKFYAWITSHPTFGPGIANFLAGKGLPLKAKILAISMLWLGVAYGIYSVAILWPKFAMTGTAIAVSIYLIKLPTARVGS